MGQRRGVAMMTVMGVLALASVIAFAAAESGHLSLGATRNRMAETRNHWLAEGCAARVLAILDEHWTEEDGERRERLWRALDEWTATLTSLDTSRCIIHMESRAMRLDLGRTQAAGLAKLIAVVAPEVPADRLASAVMKWRDSLVATDAHAVRGPLRRHALVEHLAASQGLSAATGDQIVSFLANGTGPVDIGRAPVPVLAALPGFNARSAERLANLRLHEPYLRDLYAMLGRLSQEDSDELSRSFRELSREVVFLPSSWSLIVTTGVSDGPTTTIAWNIGRSARHLVAAPEAR